MAICVNVSNCWKQRLPRVFSWFPAIWQQDPASMFMEAPDIFMTIQKSSVRNRQFTQVFN